MNPDTNNEVARLQAETDRLYIVAQEASESAQRKTNEVARLREEAKNWHQHYRDEASKAQKCKQAFIEQEKEVARLRELLKRVMQTGVAHYTSYCFERCICGAESVQEDIQDAIARLAPSPEDYKTSSHPNKCIGNVTEPDCDWRELGPDEEIHTGEIQKLKQK